MTEKYRHCFQLHPCLQQIYRERIAESVRMAGDASELEYLGQISLPIGNRRLREALSDRAAAFTPFGVRGYTGTSFMPA